MTDSCSREVEALVAATGKPEALSRLRTTGARSADCWRRVHSWLAGKNISHFQIICWLVRAGWGGGLSRPRPRLDRTRSRSRYFPEGDGADAERMRRFVRRQVGFSAQSTRMSRTSMKSEQCDGVIISVEYVDGRRSPRRSMAIR